MTRYAPDGDKIMRLHAQTATIENGFVFLPEAAPWLADYVSELTLFPAGRHDDQVNSTAQALAWPKRRSTTGIIDYWAGRYWAQLRCNGRGLCPAMPAAPSCKRPVLGVNATGNNGRSEAISPGMQTENGNRYAIHALRERRAAIDGELRQCEQRIRHLKEMLGHLDATLSVRS